MPNPIATFDTTMGTFKAELYMEQCPITVSNFMCAHAVPCASCARPSRLHELRSRLCTHSLAPNAHLSQ